MAVKTPIVRYGNRIRPLQAGDSINSSLDFTDRATSETVSRALVEADYGKTVLVPSSVAANIDFSLPTAVGQLGKWFRFINNSANLLIVRAGIANKLINSTPTYTGNVTNQANSIDANLATKMSIAAAGSTAKWVTAAAQKISLVRMYCVALDAPVLSGIDGRIQDAGGATGVVNFVPGGTADTYAYAADKWIEWPIYGGPATTKEIYLPTLPNGKAIYELEAYSETINDEFPFILVPQGCELFVYSDNDVWRSNKTQWELPERRFCGNLATAGAAFANRTELAFHLKGNIDYHIECDIQYSSANIANGLAAALNTASTPSAISYTVKMPLSATTTYENHQTVKNTGTAAATSLLTFNLKLTGNVRLPEDGIVYYADKIETAGQSVPIISGSGFAVPTNLKK